MSFWKTDASLKAENEKLKQENNVLRNEVATAYQFAKGVYTTLEYNCHVTHGLRSEILSLLGAIALQHNGEIKIKSEFIDMVNHSQNTLEVKVEQQADKSVNISLIETKNEQETVANDSK